MAADYHLDPAGDDAADGRTPATAWRSVAGASGRLAGSPLRPGDRILLRGGVEHILTAPLALSMTALHGTASAPVTVTSYGEGRAVLSARGTSAIVVHGDEASGGDLHLRIAGITLLGDGQAQPGPKPCDGILAWWNGPADLHGLVVEDVEISGFAGNGLVVGRDAEAGVLHGFVARRVWSHDNPGASGVAPHSGSGIVVAGVAGALIEDCQAARNGAANKNPGGPVGIWYWDAVDSVIRGCESFDNRSIHGDGGGFDLDGACRGCVIERCYSHGNVGAGFLFAQYAGAKDRGPLSGCEIRDCLSVDDGRQDGYGGITIWGAGQGDVVGPNVVRRVTVVMTGTPLRGTPACVSVHGSEVQGFEIRDCLFLADDGLALVEAKALGADRIRFSGNLWCDLGGAPRFRWGGEEAATIDGWRSLGASVEDRLAALAGWRPPAEAPRWSSPAERSVLSAYSPPASLLMGAQVGAVGLDVR